MSKILFFTDLHLGKDIESRFPGDVNLYGKNWAEPIGTRIVKIAKKERGSTLMSGGDEATRYSANDSTPHIQAKKSKQNAVRASRILTNKGVAIARGIGNHDNYEQADKLLFGTLSHIFEQSVLPDTQIVVMQPDIATANTPPQFSYPPEKVLSVLEATTASNIILMGHFPFAKSVTRRMYKYSNQTKPIEDYLKARLESRTLNSVMTLHGHSHRFEMRPRSQRFLSITMPSIVQEDIDRPDMPCGLFMSVGIGHNYGLLTPRFHQMALGSLKSREPLYRDVDIEYMRRYERNSTTPRNAHA